MSDAGREELIRGIEADSREEAQKLVAEAEEAALARRQAARDQAASIMEEARGKARQQVEAIRRSAAAAAAVEVRRIDLRVREQAIRGILDRVRRELRARVRLPEYRETLLGWIVEAAVGLGLPEAELNASAEEMERIDDRLLREAEERARQASGRPVKLRRSSSAPLPEQGVVLTAPDGRMAYNNQVDTRLMRRQSAVRRIIHEELFQ